MDTVNEVIKFTVVKHALGFTITLVRCIANASKQKGRVEETQEDETLGLTEVQ